MGDWADMGASGVMCDCCGDIIDWEGSGFFAMCETCEENYPERAADLKSFRDEIMQNTLRDAHKGATKTPSKTN